MICLKATKNVLLQTNEIIQTMEDSVREEFPYIQEIDLEQSQDNIIKPYKGLISLSSDEEN